MDKGYLIIFDNDDAEILYYLGIAYYQDYNYTKAKEILDLSESLYPNYKQNRTTLQQLNQ